MSSYSTPDVVIKLYPPFLLKPVSIINWVDIWIRFNNELGKYYPSAQINNPLDYIDSVINAVIYPGKYTIFRFTPLINIFLLIPGISFFGLAVKNRRKFNDSEKLVLAITVSIFLIGMVSFLIKFERYFLPLVFSGIILQAYSLHIIITQTRLLFIYFQKRRRIKNKVISERIEQFPQDRL